MLLLLSSNFSEPLNLAIGPLIYLYVKRSIKPEGKGQSDWLHFILFLIYLVYMGFYFFQPGAVKYNSYIHSKHPGWPMLEVVSPMPEDPLGLRNYINEKMGKNFFELIAQYRIEEAKRMLKTRQGSNLTIEEIAEEVGYNSKSSFNTAFKKFTGLTPSQFRTS